MLRKIPIQGSKALEMIMRDTMDGLFDSATYLAYRSHAYSFQILSIEPARPVHLSPAEPASVVRIQPRSRIPVYSGHQVHCERVQI